MLYTSMIVMATTCAAAPAEQQQLTVRVRQAIQQSIPFIEEQGVWWIEKKKCVSCHRVGTMLWSLSAAQQRGFDVSDRFGKWLAWALEKSLSKDAKGNVIGSGNKEGLVQLLMTRRLGGNLATHAESYKKLEHLIAGGQQPDGSWKPGGQLPSQKRTLSETQDVTTMWLALTLSDRGRRQSPGIDLKKTIKRIAASPSGKSTEWYALRLLLAHQQDDNETVDTIARKLLKQQSADGGWGWLVGEKSDALGTAMSLYALLRSGAGDEDVVRRARQFLVARQQPDGSWPVSGTKTKTRNRVEETATYWGTTWAVIALVESLQP